MTPDDLGEWALRGRAMDEAETVARIAHATEDGTFAVSHAATEVTNYTVLAATDKNPERLAELRELHRKWYGA